MGWTKQDKRKKNMSGAVFRGECFEVYRYPEVCSEHQQWQVRRSFVPRYPPGLFECRLLSIIRSSGHFFVLKSNPWPTPPTYHPTVPWWSSRPLKCRLFFFFIIHTHKRPIVFLGNPWPAAPVTHHRPLCEWTLCHYHRVGRSPYNEHAPFQSSWRSLWFFFCRSMSSVEDSGISPLLMKNIAEFFFSQNRYLTN